MQNKVLLIGKGQVGTYLKDCMQIPNHLHWKDDMEGLTLEKLKELKPDIVINTAAKTNTLWCEENIEGCYHNNVDKPVALYRRIKEYGNIPFIHLSSGCVWNGPYKDGQYSMFGPYDTPSPICTYAKSKAIADERLLNEQKGAAVIILRPRLVFSSILSPRNALMKIYSYPDLIDTPNSMTSIGVIHRTISELIYSNLVFRFSNVIMNVYNTGTTTPYIIGCKIAKVLGNPLPNKIDKSKIYQGKFKGVDVVMHDPAFEYIVQPESIEAALDYYIHYFVKNLKEPEAFSTCTFGVA